MTIGKHRKNCEKALASCMRLLVLIRETLIATGDTNSPLFEAVVHHSNLCGSLIPDSARMSAEELAALKKQIHKPIPSQAALDQQANIKLNQEFQKELNAKPTPAIDPAELQKRLAGGNVIVLKKRSDGKMIEDGAGLPGILPGKPTPFPRGDQ